jgi:hypothetical protein
LLAPLAEAFDMRADAELDVGAAEPDQLGCAQSGRAASSSIVWSRRPVHVSRSGRRAARRSRLGEKRHQRSFEALGWARENALDRGGVLGVPPRRVLERDRIAARRALRGGDRVRAGLALPDQPVGGARLQRRRERGHRPLPSSVRSSRWPASTSSSGAACKYQCLDPGMDVPEIGRQQRQPDWTSTPDR